jgi:hypothetical protein
MRHLSIAIAGAVAVLIAGCENSPPPNSMYAPSSGQYQQAPQYTQYSTQAPPPAPAYDPSGDSAYPDQDYESVYIDPPLDQPPPVRVDWAPPPMLDEEMPPQPYADAIWTGGYWVWQDNWVWARGRWSSPPQRGYRWVRPYYEHRGDSVIFINGFWAAPGVSFRRPPPNIVIPLARVRPGVARGPRPVGPEGAFLPPPHGARRGLIVPASEPQPQAPRAQQDQRGNQNRDQNRDRGQEQVRTPPGALRPSNESNTPPSLHPNDADRGQRDRDRNQPQQSRPPQPGVVPGAPQMQRGNNPDANQDVQRRRDQQDAAQQQQRQEQQQQRQQQQQERTQQQQQRAQQQQERAQQQQQRAQQQQEHAQQQQQRMQQQQERAQQMSRPQPQIEQHAPPRVAPPRENPPPAARPAPRPAAEPHDEQPHDDRGNRGRGHD